MFSSHSVILFISSLLFVDHVQSQITVAQDDLAMKQRFDNLMEEYKKVYTTQEEYDYRLSIFKTNNGQYAIRNTVEKGAGGSAVFGATKFFDLTNEEFLTKVLQPNRLLKPNIKFPYNPMLTESSLIASESAVTMRDWTGIYTTPVRDQQRCGSCWAFAAVEQVESDAIRTLGYGTSSGDWLSTQQVTSCTMPGVFGCNGGDPYWSFKYLMSNGLQSESSYPYVSGYTQLTGSCTPDVTQALIGVTQFYTVAPYGSTVGQIESAMASYVLNTGPLSICLAATIFQYYQSGIISTCDTSVNHCVQAVGINMDASTPYWILRNQWGTN